MRFTLKIIPLLLISYASFAGDLDNQVITRQMIQQAGLTRVAEIVTLFEGWHSFTTDGYHWMVNPLESHDSPEQKWVLMVDNQRMDLGAFNQRNLNMLPLNLNLIDSVVVSTIPRIQNGEFSEYGMIHIYTCRPLSGATFQYRYAVGNETGDPGPWTFTEYATENIDRTVMDHFSTLSIGLKKHVWGHIGFSSNYFPATDRALRKRFQNYPWEWIRVFVFSPFLQIGADAFGGEHHLNIGYASAGNSPWMSTDGSDLLFFRPLSREIPVESAFSHISLDGIWPVNSSLSILYRWKQSVNTINNVDHYDGIFFDWRMRNDYGNLEFRFTRPDWNGEIGIGYDRFYLKTKYDIRGNTISLTKLYGKVSFDRLKNCSPAFHFYLTTNGEKVTAKTSLVNIWTLNQHQQITSGLSFSQRLPDEDHNFWFWTRRGYNLLNDSTIEYCMDGNLQNNQHTNFFIKWKYRSNKSDLSIKGFIRRHKDVIAENQTFYFEDENISSSYMTVHTNVSGDVIGSQIRFQHSLFQHVILHCSYINTFPLKTDDVFKKELERFPQHKAFIVFNYEPVPSFHLQANFTFLSNTKWPEYKNVSEHSDDLYNDQIPGSFLVNFSLQKWFWNRQLRTGFLFFNCLNSRIQHYPVGASFDLSIFLNVEVSGNFFK